MRALRDVLAFLLCVVSAAALGLWAPSVWVKDTVVDRAGFLAVADPVGDDSQFRRSIADSATDQIFDAADLPASIRTHAEPFVRDQARAAIDRPVFGDAWHSSMVGLHEAILDPNGGTVTADATGFVHSLADPLQERLPFRIIPDDLTVTVPILTLKPSPIAGWITTIAEASSWLPLVGAVAAVLALLVAGHRRITAIILGVLLMLAAGVLAIGATQVELLVPDPLDRAAIIGRVIQAFETAFSQAMLEPAALMGGGGASLVAVAIIAGGVMRARRARTERG